MSSAATPPSSSQKSSSPLVREVRALYRRVCVLRASDKSHEAEILASGKLASALDRARNQVSLTESDIEAIFASEEERVDNAQALAEIILPMLSAANATAFSSRENAAFPRLADSSRRIDAVAAFTSPTESVPSESSNTGPMLPGIADFIDEMLTQERSSTPAVNLRRPA